MEELVRWLPALLAAASAVVVVATLRASQKFSEWRHDQHEKRLAAHDLQLSDHNAQLAVLQDRNERTP